MAATNTMPNKAETKKSLGRVLKEQAFVPASLGVIGILHPLLGVGAVGVYGVAKTLKSWSENRLKEIDLELGETTIQNLITKDERNIDILRNVLFKVLEESSKEKRRFYYQYLKKLDKGIHEEVDYHSKIIFTIQQVTPEEIQILQIFAENYEEMLRAAESKADRNESKPFSPFRGLTGTELQLTEVLTFVSEVELEEVLNHLSSMDLVVMQTGRMNGTFYRPNKRFGEVFLDFIKEKD